MEDRIGKWRTWEGEVVSSLIGTSLACCMGIALEIFHIEFWQISGNYILILKKICNWQKLYMCWILKFESRNDAGSKNFWGGYFYQQFRHCKGFDCKSIFLLFYSVLILDKEIIQYFKINTTMNLSVYGVNGFKESFCCANLAETYSPVGHKTPHFLNFESVNFWLYIVSNWKCGYR
jgi:hypothetical protein